MAEKMPSISPLQNPFLLPANLSQLDIDVYLFFYIKKKMKKQILTYSRSSSTISHQRAPVSFQTIYKRRNETIPAAQVYESKPFPSQQKSLTRSAVIQTADNQKRKEKQIGIHQYVKQMGITKTNLETLPNERQPFEIQDDARSQKSCRSSFSSNCGAYQLRSLALKAPKTIEELQQKIESLITQSLKMLKKQRTNIGLSKWSKIKKGTTLDQDFKLIQTYYNDLKQQLSQTEQPNQKLIDLNKKINLLQKMLANETVESDILRQQYFNWKNQRGNTSSFSARKDIDHAEKMNRNNQAFNTRKSTDNLRTQEAVTKFNSTSQCFFKKPSKQYYLRDKSKKNSYSLNRQPMERSSYSAQYLNYGYVPTYSHKVDSVPQTTGSSLAVKASSYQQEYKEKLGLNKAINVKDLDCWHDKFKHPNISFMKNSKKTANQVNALKKQPKKDGGEKENSSFWVGKKPSEPSLLTCMNMTTTGDFYKSEQNKQFIWHNSMDLDSTIVKEEILKSQIKDKKLMKLKDAFKALAIRQ